MGVDEEGKPSLRLSVRPFPLVHLICVRQLKSFLGLLTAAALLGSAIAGCRSRRPLGTIQDECSVWCDLLGYTEWKARGADLADVTAGPAQDTRKLERTLAALPSAFKKAGMPVPERQTLKDFLVKSTTPVAMRLDCCGRVNPKPLPKPVAGHPSTHHFISRVGFNANMDQALVYEKVSYGSGLPLGSSGEEWWALLVKENGHWRLKGAMPAVS